MIDPFKVFRTYVAVKLHFTDPRYDFVEKKGAISARTSSLDKRKDKAFFESAARWLESDQECIGFFVSNFVDKPDQWIGDLVRNDGRDVYYGWKRRFNDLEGELSYDITNMRTWMERNEVSWRELLVPASGYPTIFKFFRRKMVLPETWHLVGQVFPFCDIINARIGHDPIWEPTHFNLYKYGRFLVTVTKEKYGHLLEDLASETGEDPQITQQRQGESTCQA